jgi:hypothetical protein
MAARLVSFRRPVLFMSWRLRPGQAVWAETPDTSLLHGVLITPVTPRRLDLGQRSEVEIGDRLQRLGHGGASQAVRQRLQPIDTLELDPQQHVGCVVPTLEAAEPVPAKAGAGRSVGAFGSRRAVAASSGGRDTAPGARRCSARARPVVSDREPAAGLDPVGIILISVT